MGMDKSEFIRCAELSNYGTRKEVEEYAKPLTKETTCFSCGRKVMANVSKYNGHISYHCQCGINFIE